MLSLLGIKWSQSNTCSAGQASLCTWHTLNGVATASFCSEGTALPSWGLAVVIPQGMCKAPINKDCGSQLQQWQHRWRPTQYSLLLLAKGLQCTA